MSNFDKTENDRPDVSAPEVEKTEEAKTLPYTLKLEYPVVIKGKTGMEIKREELVFKKRVSAKMKAHLPLGGAVQMKRGHFLPIVAAMTEEDPMIIDALESGDEDAAIAVVLEFF
jgi:hypothetical protein